MTFNYHLTAWPSLAIGTADRSQIQPRRATRFSFKRRFLSRHGPVRTLSPNLTKQGMAKKVIRDLLFRFASTTAHLKGEMVFLVSDPLPLAWAVYHGQLRGFVTCGGHSMFPKPIRLCRFPCMAHSPHLGCAAPRGIRRRRSIRKQTVV